jgi:hypothetical protein
LLHILTALILEMILDSELFVGWHIGFWENPRCSGSSC